MTNYKKKKVIVRATNAGVFYGTLKDWKGDKVELSDCRRVWRWDGAASISQLALSGTTVPENCKFTVTVKSIIVAGVIEVIPCTKEAQESIESVPVWRV